MTKKEEIKEGVEKQKKYWVSNVHHGKDGKIYRPGIAYSLTPEQVKEFSRVTGVCSCGPIYTKPKNNNCDC